MKRWCGDSVVYITCSMEGVCACIRLNGEHKLVTYVNWWDIENINLCIICVNTYFGLGRILSRWDYYHALLQPINHWAVKGTPSFPLLWYMREAWLPRLPSWLGSIILSSIVSLFPLCVVCVLAWPSAGQETPWTLIQWSLWCWLYGPTH